MQVWPGFTETDSTYWLTQFSLKSRNSWNCRNDACSCVSEICTDQWGNHRVHYVLVPTAFRGLNVLHGWRAQII